MAWASNSLVNKGRKPFKACKECSTFTASPAAKAAKAVRVRLLVANEHGQPNDVRELPAEVEGQCANALTIIGRALAKRKRNWFDRLLVALVMRMAPKGDDFMRDPLTDDAPEFTVEELRRFQSGADKPR
jgi:menaquinone-dependent protoporphyrinogen IX oxidase